MTKTGQEQSSTEITFDDFEKHYSDDESKDKSEEGEKSDDEKDEEDEKDESTAGEKSSTEGEESDKDDSTDGDDDTTKGSKKDEDEGSSSTGADSATTDEGEKETDDDQSELEIFNALSEETGVDIASDDELVDALTELAAYRAGEKTNDQPLSAAMQEALKVEQAGGDLAGHFQRTAMDFDNMDGKEVLRQEFYKDDADLYKTDPALAKMKFERSLSQRYKLVESYDALTDEDDKSDFVEEHGMENIEYERLMLKHDVKTARDKMNAWKSEAAPVVKEQVAKGEMTTEETAEYVEKYNNQVQTSLADFEAVSIPMGEGIEDFNLGLNETTKPIVEGWVQNPSTFLEAIGFKGSDIDTNSLLPIMTLLAEVTSGTLGSRITKYALDGKNIETFKENSGKPTNNGVAVDQNRGGGDEWDQIGEAAEQARNSN